MRTHPDEFSCFSCFSSDSVQTKKRLEVETEKAIYQIQFGQIQIQITGRCNMTCQHCRAANELKQDMPIKQILKIVKFARQFSPSYKEILLSGGEPLLHHQFEKVLKKVRANGGQSVTLTTNGWALAKRHLKLIKRLNFSKFTLSVSLDSLVETEHDQFRQRQGAFERAINALRMIVSADLPNVISSARMTLRPEQIPQMFEMAAFVHQLGCKRVSFSAIHPVGRAKSDQHLWMSAEEKHQFLKNIYQLKACYTDGFKVETNDPLKCLLRGISHVGKAGQVIFDGCSAAAVTFNVGADGTMTPCALLPIPMMNVFPLSITEITERYRQSQIVHNMLDMNLKGKCGSCNKKYQCGGCRARAYSKESDYLAEDPDCWI